MKRLRRAGRRAADMSRIRGENLPTSAECQPSIYLTPLSGALPLLNRICILVVTRAQQTLVMCSINNPTTRVRISRRLGEERGVEGV